VAEQFHYNYADSTFDPILKRFEYEAGIRGHLVDRSHLSVIFGLVRHDKKDKAVGRCHIDPMGGAIIKIRSESWVILDEYQREELVFHELGHCLMGRGHCSKANNEEPISIMYPHVLNGRYYKIHREDLVDELFNISSQCIGDDGHTDEVDGAIYPSSHTDPKR
jgi:hypothetical protein